MLIIDFETRSRCDLKTQGSYKYAEDLSTDILCMGAINGDGKTWLWKPSDGNLPDDLIQEIEDAEFLGAHNTPFDRMIWECIGVSDYKFPLIKPEKWYCTSAQCRVNGLPAGLDDAAWALGLKQRKLSAGAHLIRKLSIPQKDGSFNNDPKLLQQMYDYCVQDCVVTKAVSDSIRPMTQAEHADDLLTFDINDKGVRIDKELANNAIKYASKEQAEIAEKLTKLTGGIVTKHTQAARIKTFIIEKLGESHEICQMMVVYKAGVKKFSLDKAIRSNVLNFEIENLDYTTKLIKVLVKLVEDGNKSSVAKFKRMIEMSGEGDRVRGAFVFAGAASTLRYTSRGLQLHNMKRDCWKPDDVEILMSQMAREMDLVLDCKPVPVMDGLSKMLRPAVIPADGKVFVVGDWSAIEGRVLPWLSDEAEDVLDIFRSGEDIYMKTADGMGIKDRQIGKVATLALGFQGGVGAFQSMAKNYGLTISDAEAQNIVDSWRRANHWAVRFWAKLEKASKDAMSYPNKWFTAGKVEYIFLSELMGGTLLAKMQGEHLIQYPKARLETVQTPWGEDKLAITSLKASFKPKADDKEWARGVLYGGVLAENVTQAFAAALLRDTLKRCHSVVAHIHDEIVMEVDAVDSARYSSELQTIMECSPSWAQGLPLNAEPTIMTRYGK